MFLIFGNITGSMFLKNGVFPIEHERL